MKKYKVLRNCSGFKGRRWYDGEVVEFEDDATPPHHFELISSSKKPETKPVKETVGEDPKSFSAMTNRNRGVAKSGFAKGFEGAKSKTNKKTASQALKNKKK